MGNTIQLRRGITTPTAGSFVSGEPGWDAANSKLYIKNNAGSMICINPVANPADDTLVVHISGTETITGLKTFSAAVVASTSVQSPQFNVGVNANNNIQSVNSGLNMQIYTGNTGYGVLINGSGGGRLGINTTSNPAGWLEVRDSGLTNAKLLVNASGRTLINTSTDDGANQLQVSGSGKFTGAIAASQFTTTTLPTNNSTATIAVKTATDGQVGLALESPSDAHRMSLSPNGDYLGHLLTHYDGNVTIKLTYASPLPNPGVKFEYGTRMNAVTDASYPATLQFAPRGQLETAPTLVMTQNSRVLIGTKTDDGSNRLQVSGSGKFTGAITGIGNDETLRTDSGYLALVPASGMAMVYKSGVNASFRIYASSGSSALNLAATTNYDQIQPGTHGRLVIAEAGDQRVGIGNIWANIGAKLHVKGDPTGYSPTIPFIAQTHDDTVDIAQFQNAAGSVRMSVTTAGVLTAVGQIRARGGSLSIGNSLDSAELLLENGVGDTRFRFGYSGTWASISSPISGAIHAYFNRDSGAMIATNALQQSIGSVMASWQSTLSSAGNRRVEVGDGAGNWTTTYREEYSTSGPKLAFFGSTPILKPSGDIAVALTNLGLMTSPTISATAVGAAGANTQIQFNNAGMLGASSSLTWNGSNLAVGGSVSMTTFYASGGQSFINAPVAGSQTELIFADAGAAKWSWYKGGDNSMRVYNYTGNIDQVILTNKTTKIVGSYAGSGNQPTLMLESQDTVSQLKLKTSSAAPFSMESVHTTGYIWNYDASGPVIIGTGNTTAVTIGANQNAAFSGNLEAVRLASTSGNGLLLSDSNAFTQGFRIQNLGTNGRARFANLAATGGFHMDASSSGKMQLRPLNDTEDASAGILELEMGYYPTLRAKKLSHTTELRCGEYFGEIRTNGVPVYFRSAFDGTSYIPVLAGSSTFYDRVSLGDSNCFIERNPADGYQRYGSALGWAWEQLGGRRMTLAPDGALTLANGIIFNMDTDARIFCGGPIRYQSNSTSTQHKFLNAIGTSLSSGSIVEIGTGTSGVGSGVDLLRFTGTSGQTLAKVTQTGAISTADGTFTTTSSTPNKFRHTTAGTPTNVLEIWDISSGVGSGSKIEFWANESVPQRLATVFTTATGFSAGTLTIGAAGNILLRNAAGADYQSVIAGPGTFYGNNSPTVTVGTYNGSIGPYTYTMLRNTGTGNLEFEGNQSGYVGYKFKAAGTDLVTINETSNVLTVHGDYRALKFASAAAGDFYTGWTPSGGFGMMGGAGSSLVMIAGYYNTMSAGIGNIIQSNWTSFRTSDGTKFFYVDPYETDSCMTIKSSAFTDYGDIKCRNLTLTGGIASDPINAYYVSRVLGATVNDFVNIGTVSHTDSIGSVPIRLELREVGAGMSGSHVYIYTSNYDGTSSAWRQVLPISSSGPRGGTYILEVSGYANTCQLRVRRLTTGDGATTLQATLNLSKGAIFTASSTTGTESSPSSVIASSAMLTQVGGSVVVGRSTVDGSNAPLQISGNVSIKDPSNTAYGLQFQTTNYNAMIIAATGGTDNQLQFNATSGYFTFTHAMSGTSVLLNRSASQWAILDSAYAQNIVATANQTMFETGGLRQHTLTPGAIALGHSGSNGAYSGRIQVASAGVTKLQAGDGAGTWVDGVSLSYSSGSPSLTLVRSLIKSAAGTEVPLTVDGSSGGQTANLTNWVASGTPIAYVDYLGRIASTYDFRAPAIRTIDDSSTFTVGKSFRTIIQSNNANTILFDGGVNQSTYIRSYQSGYPVVIADDGGATTFGGNISCKIITSSVSSGNNVAIINAGSTGEAGFFFRHANVDKWELYSAAGNAFGLYNYTTAAAAVTIGASNSDMTIAGSLLVSGSTLTCGVIISTHASSNNNMSLSAGTTSEVGILFKSGGTVKYQLYGTNADGAFRLYNANTTSETMQVTATGAVLWKTPTSESFQIWSDAVTIRNAANSANGSITVSTIKLTASPTVGYVWKCTNVDGSGSWQAESGGGGGVSDGDKGDITVSSSGTVWTIDNSAVTLAKIANIATATFLGRNTASSGVVEELSIATAKTMLNLTGTNSGDQTITLTGDVTGSGTSSFTTTIASNAVTFAKMQTVSTQVILGRDTGGTGNIEALAPSTVKTMLQLSGTNTGDQTITLTGDVTGSGTSSFAATIANNAVTLAKMATITTASFLGRNTASTGNVEVLSVSTVRTMLSIGNVENTALSTWPGSTNLVTVGTITTGTWSGTAIADNKIASALTGKTYNALTLTAQTSGFTIAGGTTSRTLTVAADANVSGTNTGDQTITLTGDVTGSGTSSFSATIAANAVTLAKFQQIATSSFLGRTTAGTGNVEVLSVSSVLGLILPSQTGNSGKVLSTDGTNLSWVTNGSGGTSPAGSNSQIQFNNSGSFGASANLTWSTGSNQLGVSGTILASGTITGSNLSGTNTGDQTITLTGDVTGSGTSSFSATIAANAVTLAKFQQITTASFIGRNTASTGNIEVLSVSTVKTMLNLTGTNSGDQTITLTGDVTGSGTSSFSATIANSAVTNAKMANMAAYTLKGNNTGSSAAPTDLTRAQARAMLRQSKFTMTFASSQTWDLANGLYQEVTLTGNMTLGFPSNAAEGETVYIIMKQDSTGGRTLTLNSGFKTPGGAGLTLSTGANKVDWLHIFFVSSTVAYVTIAKDFA